MSDANHKNILWFADFTLINTLIRRGFKSVKTLRINEASAVKQFKFNNFAF